MKNYIILITIFLSFITYAYSVLFEGDLLGGTELNGSGCVCHTVERDTSVTVWIEGPDTLLKGQTGIYRMYLANGPAEAGGYNVAGRFGIMTPLDTFSFWDYRSPNELTQAFPLVFPSPQDTIFWEFAYTAPDSIVIDTLYSCGLSIVYDTIPDFHDRWNFGSKFPVVVTDNIVPVEFISFTSSIDKSNVTLNWTTATETNNMGFEIEKKQVFSPQSSINKENWETIEFINGYGTTTATNTYSFADNDISPGVYQYRLKQIDYDGSFDYSNTIEVEVINPIRFLLEQNYPNPFNPSTTISWQVPVGSLQILKIYDMLGNEVSTLLNEYKQAGNYEVEFSALGEAGNLPSGVYFYQLKAGEFIHSKKMMLLK